MADDEPEWTDEEFLSSPEPDPIEKLRADVRRMLVDGRSPREVEDELIRRGLDPAYAYVADACGLRTSAVDDTGEVRAIERVDHPFFIGTLYQPQLSSTPDAPHPIWVAFVEVVAAVAAR